MSQQSSEGVGAPFGRFFLPGPTEVLPEVLSAQAQPLISHRGVAIQELMRELEQGLQRVFLTDRPVFLSTSSATGLMEAAVRNSGGGRVLSLVNGAFSARFATIARTCGREVDEYEVQWGEAHDPDEFRRHLAAGPYSTVTVAHSETSTSVLNDIASLSSVARDHGGVVFMVDSVSGFGAAEIRTDDWALDFLLTGSQKAFALPPGLAFGIASERMMERSADSPGKGYYFDLEIFAKNAAKYQTPSTPAISVMFALQVELRRMLEETMEARWARHAAMAERTYRWVDEMRREGVGVGLLAPEGHRSPGVTAITVPDGKNGPEIVAAMKDRGWVIGGGYGKLKESTFRIGHMGEQTLETLEPLLGELSEVVR